MGHKSHASRRYWERKGPHGHYSSGDSWEIVLTRLAVRASRNELRSYWPDFMPRPTDYESAGHYHWRQLHKNLTPHKMRTGRVHVVRPADTPQPYLEA